MARPEHINMQGSNREAGKGNLYLQYPDTLGSMEMGDHHYMIFDSFRSGFFQGHESNHQPNLTVALYIPPGALKTQYTSKYETLEGGEGVISGLQKQQKTNNLFNRAAGGQQADEGDVVSQIFAASKKIDLQDKDNRASIQQGGAFMMAKMLEEKSSFGRQGMVGAGVATNPYMTVFFKGPGDYRSHSFSFDFIARNEPESVQINKIVNALTRRMLPSKFNSSGHSYFLKYPDQFRINFYINGESRHRNKMFFIKRSVLTSLSVDYAGQGIPVFFKDVGQPFNIKLDLNFQELTLLTREDIGNSK